MICYCSESPSRLTFFFLQVPLVPDGETTVVEFGERGRFVELATRLRLEGECQEQIKALQAGLQETFPLDLACLLTPTQLELLVSGSRDIDVGVLRANTEYSPSEFGCSPVVASLWRVLQAFGPDDLRAFVRFACGQERLPVERIRPFPMKVLNVCRPGCYTQEQVDGDFVHADTCLFTVHLPSYSSDLVMRRQLLESIHGSGNVLFDIVD